MLTERQYILQRKEGSIGEEDMAQHGRGVGVGIHVKAGRRGTPRAALQAQRSMHPRSSPFAVAATAAATVTAAASVDELVTFCAILDR
ncbi:hypothetical protein ALC60_09350 [Trachymyrmex zeteki]|uniref:Uncharacterized protein n=1 Tax=Mycetomoellerius zeteki TaxID=64791 RepID=A0A151WUR5_9HYME|nr:hypothetical protein ALC60_09350 [Trachymyrmex zeteki]